MLSLTKLMRFIYV